MVKHQISSKDTTQPTAAAIRKRKQRASQGEARKAQELDANNSRRQVNRDLQRRKELAQKQEDFSKQFLKQIEEEKKLFGNAMCCDWSRKKAERQAEEELDKQLTIHKIALAEKDKQIQLL